jgi:hypothetical protein
MNNVGTVNIIRERTFVGALVTFEVYIDNQLAGAIKSGENLTIPVYYGNHIVSFKTIDKTINQEVMLSDQQKNVYIQVNCRMGLLTGRAHITNVYYG